MGSNSYGPFFDSDFFDRGNAELSADQVAQQRKSAAEAEALRYLAEMQCPADILEWGQRHGIPAFAEVTWNNGFMAGWIAAQTRIMTLRAEATRDEGLRAKGGEDGE